MFGKKEEERFKVVYEKGSFSQSTKILVDRKTGVNYLMVSSPGNAGGITPLLNSDGKPEISEVDFFE
jgi:hypothetical protein